MPVKTALVAMVALGFAAFAGGGVYHHFNPKGEDKPPIYRLSASDGKSGSERPFSFTALEAPKPLPELGFVDGKGRELTLGTFKGQTILLNIWATWCVPCREEMPALDRLEAKLGGPDFQVVALSIDRDGLPAVRAFYEELGLQALGIYVDQSGQAAYELGAVGIPTTLLVDPEGREIGRTVGPAEWDGEEVTQFLAQYLAGQAVAGDMPDNGE